MLLQRSASRACLRAFLLASAVLFGSFTSVKADTVNLTFDNPPTHWDGVTSTGSSAGRFNWDVGAKSGSLATSLFPALRAWTFCIQTNQYISDGQTVTYTITTSLSGLPAGGPSGPSISTTGQLGRFDALARMMQQVSFYTTYTAQLVQEAVWKLVDNDFVEPGALGTLLTAITTEYNTPTLTQNFKFFGLTNGDSQDQIILGTVEGGGFGGSIVPVPAGVVMAGMGVVFLGGFNLLRRRKMIATA